MLQRRITIIHQIIAALERVARILIIQSRRITAFIQSCFSQFLIFFMLLIGKRYIINGKKRTRKYQ
jgi:hypothetical protein